jgi:DNA-binding NarL/FixJ family response regulator
MGPVSVLVVDDNAVVRSGLCGLLEASGDVHVVGEAWDGVRAVELTRALLPDVVLLDVRMPRQDGVSAAREIAATSRVLMMTFTDDHQVIRDAVAAGASGYLVHGAFDAEDLVSSILAVARGSGVFSTEALQALRGAPEPSPAASVPPQRPQLGLSERQAEIMEFIAAGLSNGDIAARCYLSEKTVKNHINRIFAALGVRTRAEAISLWFRSSPGARQAQP